MRWLGLALIAFLTIIPASAWNVHGSAPGGPNPAFELMFGYSEAPGDCASGVNCFLSGSTSSTGIYRVNLESNPVAGNPGSAPPSWAAAVAAGYKIDGWITSEAYRCIQGYAGTCNAAYIESLIDTLVTDGASWITVNEPDSANYQTTTTASWTTSSTTISVGAPPTFAPGYSPVGSTVVADSSQDVIGTVSSWVGTTLTLTGNAAVGGSSSTLLDIVDEVGGNCGANTTAYNVTGGVLIWNYIQAHHPGVLFGPSFGVDGNDCSSPAGSSACLNWLQYETSNSTGHSLDKCYSEYYYSGIDLSTGDDPFPAIKASYPNIITGALYFATSVLCTQNSAHTNVWEPLSTGSGGSVNYWIYWDADNYANGFIGPAYDLSAISNQELFAQNCPLGATACENQRTLVCNRPTSGVNESNFTNSPQTTTFNVPAEEDYYVNYGNNATFNITGSITTGGAMTVTGTPPYLLLKGQVISGPGITAGTKITSAPAGGGAGAYTVSPSPVSAVGSETIAVAPIQPGTCQYAVMSGPDTTDGINSGITDPTLTNLPAGVTVTVNWTTYPCGSAGSPYNISITIGSGQPCNVLGAAGSTNWTCAVAFRDLTTEGVYGNMTYQAFNVQ